MNAAPIVTRAYAKINLGLEVLGRREDGLHEIVTIMQSISLADRLVFAPADHLSLRCRGMRATPDNTVLRVARLLQAHTGTNQGCAITCIKRIPVAAGLGGGSADAGTTLLALSALWGCRVAEDELQALAGQLGADVPFMLRGGTALATGTGRDLTLLPDAPRLWLALVPLSSPDGDKTREMYGQLTPDDYTDGTATARWVAALRGGTLGPSPVTNAFLRSALERWPEIRLAADVLRAAGGATVSLTGAGPSVFGVFGSEVKATLACRALRAAGLPARRCHFVPAHSQFSP